MDASARISERLPTPSARRAAMKVRISAGRSRFTSAIPAGAPARSARKATNWRMSRS